MRRTTSEVLSQPDIEALEEEEAILAKRTAEIRSCKLPNDRAVLQAVGIPERLLAVRTQLSRAGRGLAQRGVLAERVQDAVKTLLETYNWLATKLLQENNLKLAVDLLKRAENLGKSNNFQHDLTSAITYNNIACYFRRIGKLRTAVKYLEKALLVEERLGTADVAQTHLNMCAALSQLDKHDKALKHAYIAVVRVYEALFPDLISLDTNSDAIKERMTVLCIAYHNLAVEEEFLKNPSSIETYTQGLRYAEKYLDPENSIVGVLRQSLEAVKKVFAPQKSKRRQNTQKPPMSGHAAAHFDPLALLTPRAPPENLDNAESPTSSPERMRSPPRMDSMVQLPVHEISRGALPELWNAIGSDASPTVHVSQVGNLPVTVDGRPVASTLDPSRSPSPQPDVSRTASLAPRAPSPAPGSSRATAQPNVVAREPSPVVREPSPAPVVREPSPAPVVREPSPAPVAREPSPVPASVEPAPVVVEVTPPAAPASVPAAPRDPTPRDTPAPSVPTPAAQSAPQTESPRSPEKPDEDIGSRPTSAAITASVQDSRPTSAAITASIQESRPTSAAITDHLRTPTSKSPESKADSPITDCAEECVDAASVAASHTVKVSLETPRSQMASGAATPVVNVSMHMPKDPPTGAAISERLQPTEIAASDSVDGGQAEESGSLDMGPAGESSVDLGNRVQLPASSLQSCTSIVSDEYEDSFEDDD